MRNKTYYIKSINLFFYQFDIVQQFSLSFANRSPQPTAPPSQEQQ